MDKELKEKGKTVNRIKGAVSSFMSNYIKTDTVKGREGEAADLRLESAARGIGMSAVAFLFGGAEMLFTTYPLGMALLVSADRYVPFIYIGLIISSLFITGMAVQLFMLYTVAFLTRVSYSFLGKRELHSSLFKEGRLFKILLSMVMMFFGGAVRCIDGGFLWYDLFALVSGIVLSPMITYILCGGLLKKYRFSTYHDLGLCALMSFTVYSLRGYELFGFSVSAVLAFIISLYISKECGMLRGAVAGLFAGLAYNIMYAPLFAIAAIVSGTSRKLGDIYAGFSALCAGVFYGIYAGGFLALRELAPDLLAGALIYTPLAKFKLLPRPVIYTGAGGVSEEYNDRAAVSEKQNEGAQTRLRSMSEALSSLAGVFYNLSCAEKKPEIGDVSKNVEKCFEGYCAKCPRHIICWDEHYPETKEALDSLSAKVYSGCVITKEDVLPETAKRCNRIEDIIRSINESYRDQLRSAICGSKAEVFAIDYAAMASLLEQALHENEKEYEIDEELSAKLKSSAEYLNFVSNNLCVYGKRKKRIIAGGIDLARVKLGVEDLQRSFENAVGVPLSAPNFSIEGERVSMSMCSTRRFKAEYSHATLKKAGEDINGDSTSFFENRQDYFYALVSDGMGSGRDAALSSRLTGVYLDKMLRAGNKKSQSLEMLNSFLRQKNCESFATVDLFELDLLNGEGSFVKSGAAPSYILRGGSVFKISSNSMPVGITTEINAQEVKFELEDKDIVVMVSDGVSESFEDGIWLMDMLTNDWGKGMGLKDMCMRVLEEARERNSEKDDMTVSMIKIKKIR